MTPNLSLLQIPSLPGTPRLGGLSRPSSRPSSRPGSPPVLSRPSTPLFGGFQDTDPGWRTKGSLITQALPTGRISRWRFRIYVIFFFVTLALVIAHAVRLNPRIAQTVTRIWQPVQPAPYALQVLIPAKEPSLGLCKTLLTGAILNYPTPTLMNWGKNFTNQDIPDGGENMATVNAIHDFIVRLRENQKEDLLLVLDGGDIWFQLRPSTLIDRFGDLLEDSSRLTRERMGNAMSEEHIKQAAIFGSRKSCVPNGPDEIGCYPQPESPLAKDMYGANTDTQVGHNEWSSFRPRFADAGVLMASAEDVRQIMLRSKTKFEEKDSLQRHRGNDQYILNTIVGQQEFQRQVMHERWLSLKERFKRWMGQKKPSILDPHPTHEQMEHLKTRAHDFGIGLDYYGLISHQTSDAIWDGRYIKYGEDTAVQIQVHDLDCKPDIKEELPKDIQKTYITSIRVQHEVLQNKTWRDLPLYTDMCTGNVPVLLNHQGSHEERDELWGQFWMQPMAKELFRTQHRRATYASPEDFGIDTGINAGGATLPGGDRLSWEELCGAFEPELFANNPRWDPNGL